ncbi:MAG TPA: NAD(P)/FAD-dependent oxidoreductase [Bryobacteraceae bacterium]|nr:NAD(P)/FAD-dependent oxidoreductase [Bryobacteraceae bacterium]
MSGEQRHRVVIVGGGFGGLQAAKALRNAPVEVTLIDRRNFHLFQPLLYQVATSGLSPGDIAAPLRRILRRQRNTRVIMDEVTGVDVGRRMVILKNREVPYDTLVVAAGASHSYFGNQQWEEVAPGLKTLEQATEIRRRVLLAFEAAEIATDQAARRALLTFVIVGAGPTGVELAGTLGEVANDTLRGDFRTIDPAEAQIIVVDRSPRVLPGFPEDLSAAAERSLIKLGVRARTGVGVTHIDREGVTLETPNGSERIAARTVIWAAGVEASPLGRAIAEQTGATADRAGRVSVAPDCSVPGHPEIFIIGDLANYTHQNGKSLPGLCPVAMQQGRYVGHLIRARLGGSACGPFHYIDKGNLATIGRKQAVGILAGLHFSGVVAWLLWLFVHLMYLIGFQNRLLVATQWAFHYFTYNRGARLITGGKKPD